MPKFLITNDDGIDAPGLWALVRACVARGVHVTVVAPDMERSATGHAITLHRPISVRPVSQVSSLASQPQSSGVQPQLGGVQPRSSGAQSQAAGSQVRAFAVGGTPADCVKLALGDILSSPPDYLISGVNPGLNLGTDVFYSGTVSAALEGALLGVRSMAASFQGASCEGLALAAESAVDLALFALREPGWPVLVNLNVPLEPKGVAVTRLGRPVYRDCLGRRTDPRGRQWYWLAGALGDGPHGDGTDACAVMEGLSSITPLLTDMTDGSGVRELASLLGPDEE